MPYSDNSSISFACFFWAQETPRETLPNIADEYAARMYCCAPFAPMFVVFVVSVNESTQMDVEH